MQTYAKSQYVKDFTYTLTTTLNAGDGLEAVDTSGSSDTSDDGGPDPAAPEPAGRRPGRPLPHRGNGDAGGFHPGGVFQLQRHDRLCGLAPAR